MTKPANPYTYPGHTYEANGHATYQKGMTLRDYFAGQGMIGFLAGKHYTSGNLSLGEIPKAAYEMADAMLAEREKSKQ
jgi:hypothetical protein